MPDDIRKGEVIRTTVGKVADELEQRGLDPHSLVTVTIEADQCAAGTGLTGAALIAAMQASPYREVEIEPSRERLLPVRDVKL
jgi:hypothetical protein